VKEGKLCCGLGGG